MPPSNGGHLRSDPHHEALNTQYYCTVQYHNLLAKVGGPQARYLTTLVIEADNLECGRIRDVNQVPAQHGLKKR